MMSTSDRHRLLLATVVTVVALPTLWIASRDDAAPGPRVAAVGAPAPVAGEIGSEGDDGTSEPATPAYLEGPSQTTASTVARIVSGSRRVGLIGTAGYVRFDDYFPNRACQVPDAPMWAVVTVRNLDTDRITSCLNSSTGATGSTDIAIVDIDVFLEIADLVDAPLPVELTW